MQWLHYQKAEEALPEHNLSWYLRGAGIDNVGDGGRPRVEPLPACGPDEILVRVDALGLCASDAKMVRLGLDYPLFFDRNLATDPARLGHEAALTVVAVGANWRHVYCAGQRLGIQPDVFVAGHRAIFGVNIPGAMTRYVTLDRRILDGDDGSYVFPVPPAAGYAEVALLEPWACVDVAYSPTARRLEPKPGGVLWIAGRPGDERHYTLHRPLDSRLVILSDVPAAFAAWVRSQPVQVAERNGVTATEAAALAGGAGIDDIILLDPARAAAVTAAVAVLAPRGTLNLVVDHALDAAVAVEMNKLHYRHLALLGCPGPDVGQAYGVEQNRSDLRPGGVLWIVGAGGTMGRMHLQRALQRPGRPRAIIATNRGTARLDRLHQDFAQAATDAGVELVTVSPAAEPGRLEREIARLTDGRGCDDIVVVVPDAQAIADAQHHLAHDGMLVVFAGVPAGPQLHLPLAWAALHGAQFTGTSGSTVADQCRVLAQAEQGTLQVDQIVAAVGGLNAVQQGLHAVLEQRYPGKIVIFPQLVDLPLLGLEELRTVLPAVYDCLGPGASWTKAAEQALFESYWEQHG